MTAQLANVIGKSFDYIIVGAYLKLVRIWISLILAVVITGGGVCGTYASQMAIVLNVCRYIPLTDCRTHIGCSSVREPVFGSTGFGVRRSKPGRPDHSLALISWKKFQWLIHLDLFSDSWSTCKIAQSHEVWLDVPHCELVSSSLHRTSP